MKQRKQWLDEDEKPSPRVKQDLHPQKTMMCVWWGMEGVIHWELLARNQTITSELYCQQLQRLAQALQETRPRHSSEIILQHDNARSHVANFTKAIIQELG